MPASIYASHILSSHAGARVDANGDMTDRIYVNGVKLFKTEDKGKRMKDVLKSGDELHLVHHFGFTPADQVGNGSLLGPTQFHFTWSPSAMSAAPEGIPAMQAPEGIPAMQAPEGVPALAAPKRRRE
jgi:hypothetical protein